MSSPERGPARYARTATTAGGWRRSRARSSGVTTTAHAPSTSTVQSSARNGSTTIGAARYSSAVERLAAHGALVALRVRALRDRDRAEVARALTGLVRGSAGAHIATYMR